MKSLNIIGAGRVGRTLAALWHARGTFAVQDGLDGSAEGTRSAVTFIGAGRAAAALDAMLPADVWLIATPDRRIASCAQALALAGVLRARDVVFHCSGSMSSADLAPAASAHACAASVHPLKTFAQPAHAVQSFAGTYCVAEGDREALETLTSAFEDIGGRVLEIDARSKSMYHAASVIVCNYLTALMETGLRCFAGAGLERTAAARMMEPLVRETVENVFRLGTEAALTGPIARGDAAVVAGHLAVLDRWDARTGRLYRELGAVALDLARNRGASDVDALARLETLLETRPSTDR